MLVGQGAEAAGAPDALEAALADPADATTDVPEARDAMGEDAETVHPDVVEGTRDAPHVVWHSSWMRARADGLLHLGVALGQVVVAGESVGALYNSFGRRLSDVKAELGGVVIGRTEAPLVHRGDAIVHIGELGGRPGSTFPSPDAGGRPGRVARGDAEMRLHPAEDDEA